MMLTAMSACALLLGCAPGGPSGPFPSPSQKLSVTGSGSHCVEFSYQNRTSRRIATPQVLTSCGCHITEVTPEGAILPGGECRIRIRQASALFPARGSARIVWSNDRTDGVEWVFVLSDSHSFLITPSSLSKETLRNVNRFTLAFVADYPGQHAPPTITASVSGIPLEATVHDCNEDGPGRYQGYVSLTMPRDFVLQGPNLLVEASDLDPVTIPLH